MGNRQPTPEEVTRFFLAIEKNDLSAIKELMASDIEPSILNQSRDSALLVAATDGKLEVFNLFDQSGALNSLTDDEKSFLLYRAGLCWHNDESIARKLFDRVLEITPKEVRQKRIDRLLMFAARDRSPEYVQMLVDLGADPNYEEDEYSLLIALWKKRDDIVEILLKAGANPNSIVPKGRQFNWTEDIPRAYKKKPIIDLAIGLKADKIVRLLKAAGAKPTEAEAISVSMDIVESWKRIEKWLKGNAPNWKPLKKAATEAQIKHLEKELGVTLPEDFKLSYRRHNEAEDLFPETDISYSLIPTTQILSDWKMLNGLVESGDFDNRKATSDTGIQKKWWTPDWIPFASNGGGDYFCLDLKPLKKGTVGQIISVNHESGERRLQAPSFAHWLFDFANQLKAGTWKYEEGEGLVS